MTVLAPGYSPPAEEPPGSAPISPSTAPTTELRPDVLPPLELPPLELAPLELAPLELAPLELAPLELVPALLPAVPVEGVDDGVADGVDDGAGDGADDGAGDGVELAEVPPVIPPSARTSLVTLPRPGTRLLAGDMPGMMPLTTDRSGRAPGMTPVLLVLLASRFDAPLPAASDEGDEVLVGLVVLVGLEMLAVLVVLELPVVFEMQDAPVAPVSAGVKDRLVWSQRTLPAADTPRSWVSPVSDDTGVSARAIACASAGAASPTVRMPADAAPPNKIRQLYTKYSTSSWVMELAAI